MFGADTTERSSTMARRRLMFSRVAFPNLVAASAFSSKCTAG